MEGNGTICRPSHHQKKEAGGTSWRSRRPPGRFVGIYARRARRVVRQGAGRNNGYNRNSTAKYREENHHSAKDDLYNYDDLDRLDVWKRGDLNAGKTDITSPVRDQDWTLDLLANWSSIATNSSSVGRTHNRSNEITDIDTGQSGNPPCQHD